MESMETKSPLGELHLNLTGKLLLASIGSWLVGKAVNTSIRGTVDEVESVKKAMIATKILHEELRRPGASVESVVSKMKDKNSAAQDFENLFGIPWPL
jgi:hypothetical protein